MFCFKSFVIRGVRVRLVVDKMVTCDLYSVNARIKNDAVDVVYCRMRWSGFVSARCESWPVTTDYNL